MQEIQLVLGKAKYLGLNMAMIQQIINKLFKPKMTIIRYTAPTHKLEYPTEFAKTMAKTTQNGAKEGNTRRK